MLPTLLALAAVAVVVALVQRARRTRDPLGRRFLQAAERAGLEHLPASQAIAALDGFDDYLSSARGVDVAIGQVTEDGAELVITAIGARNTSISGRPWYVGVVRDPALRLPRTSLEPRSVRTVRLVAGRGEVVVRDSRLARGWRVTADDPDAAARMLDDDDVRERFADVLHRPIPWIIGLQMQPGAVAVHLSNPAEAPSDADDVQRLAKLVGEVAAALRPSRSAPGAV